MNAVSIGPLVLDGGRLAAVVALFLFFVLAEVAARRQDRDPGGQAMGWITLAALVWILAARLGYIIVNRTVFAAHPLDAIKLWQGGFLPAAGWTGGVAVLALAVLYRRAALMPLAIGGTGALVAWLTINAALSPAAVTLPNLRLTDLDGGTVELSGGDRPVVLNLWATWCPPCRREMPMMTDLASQTPGVDFIFANQGEETDQIRTFLGRENLPETGMLRDPGSQSMGVLNAIGLPSTLVFDANGKMVAAHTGEISRAALTRMIEQAAGGVK